MKQTDANLAIRLLQDVRDSNSLTTTDEIVSVQNVINHLSTYFTAPGQPVKDVKPRTKLTGTALAELILATRQQNTFVKPIYNPQYACETCGNDTGSCHPETGNCFVCGSDDFIDIDMWRAGIRGEAYIKILERMQ
jgi:hypothetical protein